MAKKKTVKLKKLVIRIPDEGIVTWANTKFIKNGDPTGEEMFFQNPNYNKKVTKKELDGYLVQIATSRLMHGVIGNGKARTTSRVTVAELEKLLKEVKKSQKYWEAFRKKRKQKVPSIFFYNLTPEVHFMIEG